MKAIGRDVPIIQQSLKMLVSAVSKKSSKLVNYEKKALRNCLIVDDVDNILRFRRMTQIIGALWNGESRSALIESGFREVYVITMHEKEGAVVVPILANLLAAEVITFEQGFIEHFTKVDEMKTAGECMMAVASRLISRFPGISYWSDGEELYFELGGFSMGAVQVEKRNVIETIFDFDIERKLLAADVTELSTDLSAQIEQNLGKSFMAFELFYKVKKTEMP